jgi:hypothetical protein
VDQTEPEDQAFSGTSKNAGLIQVWTALIAYLLLASLKFTSKVGWDLWCLPPGPDHAPGALQPMGDPEFHRQSATSATILFPLLFCFTNKFLK